MIASCFRDWLGGSAFYMIQNHVTVHVHTDMSGFDPQLNIGNDSTQSKTITEGNTCGVIVLILIA